MTVSPAQSNGLFSPWFTDGECLSESVRVLNEREGGREEVFDALVHVAADHVVGLRVIEKLGGFPEAVDVLKNRLPQRKIARSGMLGEILATEFLDHETEFSAPVRRLQYRDTREQAMRGDDVIGVCVDDERIRVMKVEAKSRARLATAAIVEARDGLAQHQGRPNPETLAFLDCILRKEDRDEEASVFTKLQQSTIRDRDVCHLLFTLSGNNPTSFLEANDSQVQNGIELRLCGCKVSGHAAFVKRVFDCCMTGGVGDGDS